MLQINCEHSGLRSAAPLNRTYAPRALNLVERLRAAIDEDPQSARLMLDELSVVLAPALAGEGPSFASIVPASPQRGGLAAWQLRQVKIHIEENLADRLHVETLASLARLSTSHFCRAFKNSTGETAHTYIMRRRLERAQALMLGTAESLCQIAAACGLADQAHLTRLFRRYTGQTPFNWRRTFRTLDPALALPAA